ncbi:MAG: hypothetical protein HKM95_04010 [Inquilinus sp.]|nr:hypothetical protein [Inquilinus sp.]
MKINSYGRVADFGQVAPGEIFVARLEGRTTLCLKAYRQDHLGRHQDLLVALDPGIEEYGDKSAVLLPSVLESPAVFVPSHSELSYSLDWREVGFSDRADLESLGEIVQVDRDVFLKAGEGDPEKTGIVYVDLATGEVAEPTARGLRISISCWSIAVGEGDARVTVCEFPG